MSAFSRHIADAIDIADVDADIFTPWLLRHALSSPTLRCFSRRYAMP